MLEERFEASFHASLHRPLLIFGAEREPMLFTVIAIAAFVFNLMTWWGLLAGIVAWALLSWALGRMAIFDPQLTKTWLRSVGFRKRYKARATPFARPRAW